MNSLNFEYYAMIMDSNSHEIKQFNIFNNIYVYSDTLIAVVNYLTNVYTYDEYVEAIDKAIRLTMQSRFEYEIGVGDAFPKDLSRIKKLDVYYQTHANINTIANNIIITAKEFFYHEDALNIYTNIEAKREQLYIDTHKMQAFYNKEAAIGAITEEDLYETDGDLNKYMNWYIKKFSDAESFKY